MKMPVNNLTRCISRRAWKLGGHTRMSARMGRRPEFHKKSGRNMNSLYDHIYVVTDYKQAVEL